MTTDDRAVVPVWTLATEASSLPGVFSGAELTATRLAELRTVLAALAETPIATLELHAVATRRDRSRGILLHAASPLARQLSQLVVDTVKSATSAEVAAPAMKAAASGEVLYRMVVPANVAAQLGQGLIKPLAARSVPGGIYGGLSDGTKLTAQAAFVAVTGKTATAGAGAVAAGAGGAAGAAGAVGATAAAASVITVAAPLVLMAVAVGMTAHAEHERQQAIERITTLLEQLHEDNLDRERSELDGCRDAIDKATAILLDQGRIGPALGLDSAVHAISKSLELSNRRLVKWQDSLRQLPDGPVELATIMKAFPGISDEGGLFRAHLELARLTIALKRRVLILQAVEHAQLFKDNPFTNFVRALQDDERRVNDLETGLNGVLHHLSTVELKRRGGLLHPVFTPGEVDTLLRAAYRLRALNDEADVSTRPADVSIEIERSRDGSLVVYPAAAT